MTRKRRVGLLLATFISIVSMSLTGTGAHAATTPGSAFVDVGGYVGNFALNGAASCDTTVGGWMVNWSMTFTFDAPTVNVVVDGALSSGVGATQGTATAPAGPGGVTRVLRFASTSGNYASGDTVAQVITYSVSPGANVGGVVTKSSTGSFTASVDVPATPCDAPATTTTTTLAPTTATANTVAPTTTAVALITPVTVAPSTTNATVLAAAVSPAARNALPSTGSNTGAIVAVGFTLGIVGITLVRVERKRKLYR